MNPAELYWTAMIYTLIAAAVAVVILIVILAIGTRRGEQ